MAIDREDAKIIADEFAKALRIPTSGISARNLLDRAPEQFKEELKKQIRSLQDLAKQHGATEQQLIKFRLQAEEATEGLTRNARAYRIVSRVLDTTEKAIRGFADSGRKGADTFSTFTKAFEGMPLLGNFNDLANSFDFNIGIFRALSSQGADFGQSLIRLRQAAADARLPLLEFVDLTSSNAVTLAALFGTVNQGIPSLTRFTEQLRTQGIPQLAALGLTTENLNEFLTTYLDIQRVQQRFQRLSDQEITANTISYAKELDRLTRLTGIQRERLDEEIKRQNADAIFQTYLQGLDEKQAMASQQLVATVSQLNPALGTSLKNFLATGVQFDELSQQASALVPGFSDAVLAFRSGQIGIDQVLTTLRDGARNFRSQFNEPAVLLGGGLENLANAFLPLSTLTLDTAKASEEQLLAQESLTKNLAEFNESAKRLKAGFETIQTSILIGLGPLVSGLVGGTNEGFIMIGNALANFSKDFPGVVAGGFVGALAGKYLFDKAAQILIIATGVRIGQTSLTSFMKGITGTFMRTTGTMLGLFTRIAGPLASIVTILSSLSMIFNEETRARGVGGVAGGVAGYLGGRMAARAIGAAIGGTVGTFIGGPIGTALGTALGTVIGTIIGQMMGGSFDSRLTGTDGETGRLLETKDTLTKVHRGEMVLPAKTAKKVADAIQEEAVTSVVDQDMIKNNKYLEELITTNKKVERYLSTVAAATVKTADNTGKTISNIKALGGIIQ